MYFFKNSKNQFFLKKMYFFKNSKKNQENYLQNGKKKVSQRSYPKIKKNQEKSGESEKSCEIYKIWLSKIN